MKLTHVIGATLCIGMILVACQKEQFLSGNEKTPAQEKAEGQSDQDVMAKFFDQNRKEDRQYFKIRADKGGEITAESGTKLIIEPNQLRNADGSEIAGYVTVSVLEVYDRDEKVLDNFTTDAAFNPNQENQILTSAATFDVDMKTENGGDVITANNEGIEVNIPTENAGGPDNEMVVWKGEESADQPRDNAWEENGEPLEIVGDHYRLHLAAPWYPINLDKRLMNWANAIHLRVGLPAGYTSANAEVFVVFDGFAYAIASMDVFDPLTNLWGEHLGLVDPGTPIHIVSVGVDPVTGGLVSNIKAVVTSVNNPNGDDLEIIPTMTPTTTAALTAAINALP